MISLEVNVPSHNYSSKFKLFDLNINCPFEDNNDDCDLPSKSTNPMFVCLLL